MFSCAECQIQACRSGVLGKMPQNCPMRNANVLENSRKEYDKNDIREFSRQAARVEGIGYCQWTRVQEIVFFCKQNGYQKIGVAFCGALKNEASVFTKVLRSHGFTVSSLICKNGAFPKEMIGIKPEEKLREGHESMCNPIGQAMFLNQEKVDFIVSVGLCVGHDSLLFKYADAPVTVLVAKDRVLAHNPVGALYCADGYYKKKLFLQEE